MLEAKPKQTEFFIAITPSPLWHVVVVLISVPCMGEIDVFDLLVYLKLFNCVQTIAILETI